MSTKKVGFVRGGKAVCSKLPDEQSLLRLGEVYDVVSAAGGAVVLADLAGYKHVTISKKWLSPYEAPAPAQTAPASARWFVIDLTKESLVALRLENRAAGVQWIRSFGNLSHQYIVAKETGEFTVSREVAEV